MIFGLRSWPHRAFNFISKYPQTIERLIHCWIIIISSYYHYQVIIITIFISHLIIMWSSSSSRNFIWHKFYTFPSIKSDCYQELPLCIKLQHPNIRHLFLDDEEESKSLYTALVAVFAALILLVLLSIGIFVLLRQKKVRCLL